MLPTVGLLLLASQTAEVAAGLELPAEQQQTTENRQQTTEQTAAEQTQSEAGDRKAGRQGHRERGKERWHTIMIIVA